MTSPWGALRTLGREGCFALGFFTRCPLPATLNVEVFEVDPARTLVWAPWVGALLGGFTGWIGKCVAVFLPPSVAVWVMLALYALLGWSLHLDGWSDLADGWGSGQRGEAMRRIMKDSRVGGFGALALLLAAGLWTSAGATISPERWSSTLALAGALGRFALASAAFFGTYPWQTGLGKRFVEGFDGPCLARTVVVVFPLALLNPFLWVLGMPATFAVGALFAFASRRWIGGTSGDVLGAAAVGGELLAVLLAAGI